MHIIFFKKLICVYQQIGGSEILVVLRTSFSILPLSFSVAFSAMKNKNGMQRMLPGWGMYTPQNVQKGPNTPIHGKTQSFLLFFFFSCLLQLMEYHSHSFYIVGVNIEIERSRCAGRRPHIVVSRTTDSTH